MLTMNLILMIFYFHACLISFDWAVPAKIEDRDKYEPEIRKHLPAALRLKFICINPLFPRLTQYELKENATEFIIEVTNAVCLFGRLTSETGGQINGLKSVDCGVSLG
ncbi:hypothetical protein FGIG_11637 [Fasciola gigantica]|uniref:Uncharacterized protein n=1 Tax=Fasciola gigantica TaxID=46835 RepID=A0A504YKH5_FASGI|nr:hypothetical protein FGIG_11637 [Fasciola gigantica]